MTNYHKKYIMKNLFNSPNGESNDRLWYHPSSLKKPMRSSHWIKNNHTQKIWHNFHFYH